MEGGAIWLGIMAVSGLALGFTLLARRKRAARGRSAGIGDSAPD